VEKPGLNLLAHLPNIPLVYHIRTFSSYHSHMRL
jgi:hypothetical protein